MRCARRRCDICHRIFRGFNGVYLHKRVRHRYDTYMAERHARRVAKEMDAVIMRDHEESYAPEDERFWLAFYYLRKCNRAMLQMMVKWEAKGILQLAHEHPLYRSMKFKWSPWPRVISWLVKSIGIFTLTSYATMMDIGVIDRSSEIDLVIDHLCDEDFHEDLMTNYDLVTNDTGNITLYKSMSVRTRKFITYVLGSSHVRVLMLLKMMLGQECSSTSMLPGYPAVNIYCHASKYLTSSH